MIFYFLFWHTGGLTGLDMSEEGGDFSAQFGRRRVETFGIGMKPPPHQFHRMQLPLLVFTCCDHCHVGICTRKKYSKKEIWKSQCPSRCSIQSTSREFFVFGECAPVAIVRSASATSKRARASLNCPADRSSWASAEQWLASIVVAKALGYKDLTCVFVCVCVCVCVL